jgi:hypothetical protein
VFKGCGALSRVFSKESIKVHNLTQDGSMWDLNVTFLSLEA